MSTRKRNLTVAISRELLTANIREVGGANQGEFVRWLQQEVDGQANGEPWCACSVMKVQGMAERFLEALGEPEPSPVPKSEHCMTYWRAAQAARRTLPEPMPGAIMIWNKLGTDSGHMGRVLALNADGTVETAEGNTGPGLGVEREGDGFYRKTRSREGFGDMKVVGYVDP